MRRRKAGGLHDDGRRQSELFPPSPTRGDGAGPHGREAEAGSRGAGGAFATVMPIDGLNLPPEALGLLRESYGGLNGMQADSVRAGLLEGQSVLVSAPTSGGKTLVALMAILACLSRNAGRAVYLCPMRSLAEEQHRGLQRLESIEINGRAPRVAMTTGERDVGKGELESADVVVMTNERLDVLMRQDRGWRERVGLMVVDEIHMVGDGTRGPILETVITHARNAQRPPQLVGLSATVPNARALAHWLGARVVRSGERPVPLHVGIYDGDSVHIKGREFPPVEKDTKMSPALRVGIASALEHKTILFARSRRDAVSFATRAAEAIKGRIPEREKRELRAHTAKITGKPGKMSNLVRGLVRIMECGVAFHHAGLDQNCRDAVEAGFRDGGLRLVVSTPTLAVGVNLPARRVIVASLSRHHAGEGNQAIGVGEFKQMVGRAGRPSYDSVGEAIVVTSPDRAQYAKEKYIDGEPEPVMSQIAEKDPMRTHLLSLVTIYPGMTEGEITGFFRKTLARIQIGNVGIGRAVLDELRFLCKNGFMGHEDGGRGREYFPTEMGILTTRLYLEPSTALEFIKMARLDISGAPHTLGLVYAAITYSRGRKNYIGDRQERQRELLGTHTDELLDAIYDENSPLERSAIALWDWLDESAEEDIANNLGIESGELHEIRVRAERALYCLEKISGLLGNTALSREAVALKERTRHGIRAELLDLTKLRGIGRTHARKLYRKEYTTRESMRSLSAKELDQITSMGKRAAEKVLAQVR